jgi:hypothetical protein
MPLEWKLDESNNMNAVVVGRGHYLDTLATIPEDVSVAAAAAAAAAAFQDRSSNSIANLSTVSAVGSFSDSGNDGVANVVSQRIVHRGPNKDITRKNRRGKRPRPKGGFSGSTTGAVIANAMMGNDNLSDTHASLGGVADSFGPASSPPLEEAPKRDYTMSIFSCTTRISFFFLVLVWVLIAMLSVGIYVIVTKVSSNGNGIDGSDTTSIQPTQNPVFPPYHLEKESLYPSKAPTYNENDIMNLDAVMRNISGVDAVKMNDTSVPEGRCRYWLTNEDALEVRVDVEGKTRVEQRYILCLLYHNTNGQSWTVPVELWLDGESHECDWYGITCNTDDVVAIELDNKNLNGTIPEALLSLTNLHLLRLPNNTITGKIPPNIFNTLTDLRWLEVSNNALTGTIPASTANVSSSSSSSSLEAMYVKGNQLEGGLPFFPNLQRVRAQRNSLTFLDERYATAGQNLIYLYVYHNQLVGSLPSTWNTPNLQILDLGFNKLQGPLPQELWDLPALRSLVVDNNQLTGNLPSSSNCRTLHTVWLSSNRLDGPIPSNFGLNWANLTSLNLQDNDITGTISRDHCNYWPISMSAESSDWELKADCNTAMIQCECCTQCFPNPQ